ncbi:hypothetical protein ACTFIV_000012, partial [Dictyostelium citrinum]
WD